MTQFYNLLVHLSWNVLSLISRSMDHQVTPEEAVPNTIAVDINSKYYLAGH